MRIIHFINIATKTNVEFIKTLHRLIPGHHYVVNQDPHANEVWTIEGTDIEVEKALLINQRMLSTWTPDVLLNYTDTPEYCNFHNVIEIETAVPEEDKLTVCMVDLDSIKQVNQNERENVCKVINLSDEDNLDFVNGRLAYYIAAEGEHEPRRMIECMAAGIPIVVNRTEITSMLITNGVNGILVDTEDNVDKVLKHLIFDPDTREELGRESRTWAETTADIKKVVSVISTSTPKLITNALGLVVPVEEN